MRIRKVPSNLQIKVIKWFDYLWLSQKSTDEERSISCLPGRNMCRLNAKTFLMHLQQKGCQGSKLWCKSWIDVRSGIELWKIAATAAGLFHNMVHSKLFKHLYLCSPIWTSIYIDIYNILGQLSAKRFIDKETRRVLWLLVDIAVKIEELYSLQITILILISDFQINWKARSPSTCTWTRWRGWRSSRTRRRGSCASSCSASSPSSSRPGTTSAEKVKTQTYCVTDIGDCRLSANVVLLGRLVEV